MPIAPCPDRAEPPPLPAPASADGRPAGWRHYLHAGRVRWERLGLTAQFVILALSLFLILSWIAGSIQNQIVSRTLQSGSLEIEQAIVNAAVSDLLPTGRLTSALSAEAIRALDRRLQAATLPTDITRIKLWTVHGRLAYDTDVVEQPLSQPFCGFAGLSVQALTIAA